MHSRDYESWVLRRERRCVTWGLAQKYGTAWVRQMIITVSRMGYVYTYTLCICRTRSEYVKN
jgi:hypothetical protein